MRPAFRRKFERLTKDWKNKFKFSSGVPDDIPSYRKIIAMGKPVLPLIFEDFYLGPSFWFGALGEITGENPVPKEHAGRIMVMRKYWLDWAKANGYAPLWHRGTFKYFDDHRWLFDFLLRTGSELGDIVTADFLKETETVICDFPLDPQFKRPGDFWVRGNTYREAALYHVLEDGTCLRSKNGWLPSYVLDVPYFSNKEWEAIHNFITLFGTQGLAPHVYERYWKFRHLENLRAIERNARLGNIKSLKEFPDERDSS